MTPLEPADLALEITENSFMTDPQQVLRTMREIARRDVGVSIDDSGTGYSSLAYLNALPATEVKLNRSFIRRVTTDERTAAIVAGTVKLAPDLGALVVAEGVEDLAALERLRTLGCDEIQGFLVGTPMPPEEFLAWYRNHSGLSRAADPQHAIWGYRSASG